MYFVEPLSRTVTDLGFLQPSTNVNFSSPYKQTKDRIFILSSIQKQKSFLPKHVRKHLQQNQDILSSNFQPS